MRARSILAVAVLVGLPLLAAIVAPVFAAAVCPGCYGFRSVAPGVYLERGFAEAEVLAALAAGRARVTAALGPVDTATTFLVCRSTACERRLGATGPKAVAYGSRLVVVSPRGVTDGIFAHELTHIAVKRRLGLRAQFSGRLPA